MVFALLPLDARFLGVIILGDGVVGGVGRVSSIAGSDVALELAKARACVDTAMRTTVWLGARMCVLSMSFKALIEQESLIAETTLLRVVKAGNPVYFP